MSRDELRELEQQKLISIQRQFGFVSERTNYTILELAILEILKSTQSPTKVQGSVHAHAQKDKKTIQALKDIAIKHGYNLKNHRPDDGNLVDWVGDRLSEIPVLRSQIEHWKKKYEEKIFHNE